MKIKSVQITNYKSYRLPELVALSPGFNVVVGPNNVGKTALLSALAFASGRAPHTSLKTMPTPATVPPQDSTVVHSISGGVDDIDRLLALHNPAIGIPSNMGGPSEANSRSLLADLRTRTFTLEHTTINGKHGTCELKTPTTIHGPDSGAPAFDLSAGNSREPNKIKFIGMGSTGIPRLEKLLGAAARSDTYGFRAERLNIGKATSGTSMQLSPDARNLPEVIHILQSTNPHLFTHYLQLVRRVFPAIRHLSAVPVSPTEVEIHVWEHEISTERPDLAVPLTEGGTGVGQAAALLFVLATATTSRTFIIDEPNSFLHPGALRELLCILIEHPQHQYIISSHAPQVISTLPDDSQILLVDKRDFETSVTHVDMAASESARAILNSVGARLSDVFGVEQVLWVEGPTEERCFDLLRVKMLKGLRADVLIRGVVATGDFGRRSAFLTSQIYKRLSQPAVIIPEAVGFLFDSEMLDEEERDGLTAESQGAISFIPARMYECYLLNADAIAARLRIRNEPQITTTVVAVLLAKKLADPKLGGGPSPDRHKVNAAKILSEIFSELSESRRQYNKIEDGYELTQWLLREAPEDLTEVAECLKKKLSACAPRRRSS